MSETEFDSDSDSSVAAASLLLSSVSGTVSAEIACMVSASAAVVSAALLLQAHTDTASAAVRITAIIFFFIVIIPFLPDLHLGALILTKFPPSVNPEETCALLTDKQTDGIITLLIFDCRGYYKGEM